MSKTHNINYNKIILITLRFFLSIFGGFLGAFTLVASLYLHLEIITMLITATISFIIFGCIMWLLSSDLKKGMAFTLSLMIVSIFLPPIFKDLSHGIGIVLFK